MSKISPSPIFAYSQQSLIMSISNPISSTATSNNTLSADSIPDNDNSVQMPRHGIEIESVIKDLDFSKANRSHEAIIHIPDETPCIQSVSFTPSLNLWSTSSNSISMEHGTNYSVIEQDQLESNDAKQNTGPYRRSIKDSNNTLTSIHFKTSDQKEEDPTGNTDDSQAIVTRQSALKLWFGFSSQSKVVDTQKVLPEYSRKRRLESSYPNKMPSMESFSGNGKRYHDPKKSKKAEKEAFKTATTLFSNERTFLHWIKFAMVLGSMAMTLLNFSGDDVLRKVDQSLAFQVGKIGQYVGAILLALCLFCLVYASIIHHWRHHGVAQNKHDDRYFDRIGPTVITFILLVTYFINVILTLKVTSNMDPDYSPKGPYNSSSELQNPTAPPYSDPSSSPFDTPPLPNGSSILVDDDGDDDDDYVSSSSSTSTNKSTNSMMGEIFLEQLIDEDEDEDD